MVVKKVEKNKKSLLSRFFLVSFRPCQHFLEESILWSSHWPHTLLTLSTITHFVYWWGCLDTWGVSENQEKGLWSAVTNKGNVSGEVVSTASSVTSFSCSFVSVG